MIGKSSWFLLATFVIAACRSDIPPCASLSGEDVIYIVGQGWHAEIGIPVEELGQNLAFYRSVFVGATTLMFGYGKKTFFTAPVDDIREYVLGPFPGPAVIHVVGLSVTPFEAYGAEDTVILTLPPGGARALSDFIWEELSKDKSGKPEEIARSQDPDGLFYAAEGDYNLMHTCNTWTADALHAAGLPISGAGVIFSGQVMARVAAIAENRCASIR